MAWVSRGETKATRTEEEGQDGGKRRGREKVIGWLGFVVCGGRVQAGKGQARTERDRLRGGYQRQRESKTRGLGFVVGNTDNE